MLMAEVEHSDWADEEPRRTVRNRITHYITSAYRGTIPFISSCFSGARRRQEGDDFTSLQNDNSFRVQPSQRSLNRGPAYALAASEQSVTVEADSSHPFHERASLDHSPNRSHLSENWELDRSTFSTTERRQDTLESSSSPDFAGSPNRAPTSTALGQPSLSSPMCMEPATTFMGQEGGGEAQSRELMIAESWRVVDDHDFMAFSSTAARSSMDADLALAIALQAEEEEEEARAMQEIPPPFIGVHTTYKELPCFLVEGAKEALADDAADPDPDTAPARGLSAENQSCIICLTDYVDGDQVRLLPCLHRFHVVCIDPWLEASTYCPSCKLSVTTGRMQEETPQRRVPTRHHLPPPRPRVVAQPQYAPAASWAGGPRAAALPNSPASASLSPASRASQRSTPMSASRR